MMKDYLPDKGSGKQKNKRDPFWDVVKGQAVCWVMLAHTGMTLMPFVHMFTLQIFYFVAGYFFSERYAADPYANIAAKVKSLWLPTVKYGLVFVALHDIFLRLGIYSEVPFVVGGQPSPLVPVHHVYHLTDYLVELFNTLTLLNLPELCNVLWFVPMMLIDLFLLGAVLYLAKRYFASQRLPAELVMSGLIYGAGCYLVLHGAKLPWHAQMALVLFLPTVLGLYYRRYGELIRGKDCLALAGLLVMVGVYYFTGNYPELSQDRIVGVKWFALLFASGCLFHLGVCRLVMRSDLLTRVVSYIGNRSLWIIAYHLLAFRVVSWFSMKYHGLPRAARASFPCIGFPLGSDWWWLIYAVAGIALPLLWEYLWQQLKRWYMKHTESVRTDCHSVLERLEARLEAIDICRVYAAVFFGFGLIFMLVNPPFETADEQMHIYRAWQQSEGKLVAPISEQSLPLYIHGQIKDGLSAEVPRSLVAMDNQDLSRFTRKWTGAELTAFLKLPLASEDRVKVSVATTGPYSPMNYLPQITGAVIGRSLSLPAGGGVYLMRLLSLLWATACVYWSLRLLPVKRLLVFLLAMMPMFLAQCASASADAVLLPGCLLIGCWLLGLREKVVAGAATYNWQVIAGLVLAAVFIGLTKSVYGTIMFLYFLLPAERFGGRVRFYGLGVILLVLVLAVSGLWTTVALHHGAASVSFVPGTDRAAQMSLIKAEPLVFARLLLREVLLQGNNVAKQFIGVLSWLTIYLPRWFYWLYAGALIAAAACGRVRLKLSEQILLLFGAAASVLAVFAAEYIFWTPVGKLVIEGVQGRYFIPVALLAALPLSRLAAWQYEKSLGLLLGLLSGAVTVWSVMSFFY